MDAAKRIIVNTGVQYAKAVITTCISLYSTRLILDALSVNDFGIYTLVAGVVTMLGFITNALMITTQRYLSFNQTKESNAFLHKIFANSLLLHILLGLIIAVVLFALKGILFEHVLNIDESRRYTAELVYITTVLMLFITILTSPFKALFIAHENIVFIASVEIIDSIVKLLLAIELAYIAYDRLFVYAIMMAAIVMLNLLAYSFFGLFKYKECSIVIRKKDIDKLHLRNLIGFAGWTTYGMACVAARNQGTAVVLNHFLGTVVNAAYGIAFQINNAIVFLIASIQNAMNPQLMQAEGAGNRRKMLSMAAQQSKFAVAILAMAIIPLIAEMPTILGLWLKEVPKDTDMFCRFILLAFLADQMTVGLSSANQAVGQIRNFTLLTYTPKLLYLPIIWILLAQGCSTKIVMLLYAIVELSVAIIRIPYMKYKVGLGIISYVKEVIIPTAAESLAIAITCWISITYIHSPYRFIFTLVFAGITGLATGWFLVLNSTEREYIVNIAKKTVKI